MENSIRIHTNSSITLQKEINNKLKELEDLKFAIDQSSIIAVTDEIGTIIDVNDKFCEISKYDRDDLLGKNHRIVNSGYHDKEFFSNMWKIIKGGTVWRGQIKNKAKDGSYYWVHTVIVPFLNKEGNPYQYMSIRTDVTEQKKYEEQERIQKLKLKEKQFNSLIQNSHEVAGLLDDKGKIVYQSQALEHIFGYKPEELIGKSYLSIVHSEHLHEAEEIFKKTINNPGVPIGAELMIKHANGKWCFCDITAKNLLDEKSVNGVVINFRDITDKKKMQEEIRYLAYFDSLTGLPNKKQYKDYFVHIQKKKKHTTLFNLDIDNFKFINDTLGVTIGDGVLKKVAKRLLSLKSKHVFIARDIGDRFVILVSERIDIDTFARSILKLFEDAVVVKDYDLYVTTSIGISTNQDGKKMNIDSLLKNANLALSNVKKTSKNDYYIWDPKKNIETYRSFKLLNDLKKAIREEQFIIYYQPRIDTKTNEILGAEALIRWEHPEWGLIPPNEFIPLAEKSGSIIPLGDWIFRNVIVQQKEWEKRYLNPIKVSINLSPIQFLQKDFIKKINQAIDEYEINTELIEFEITETVVLENEDLFKESILSLKKMGFSIAIDDFGTGYSSILYLKKHTIDTIKIDRSFVADIEQNTISKEILDTIIILARKLNVSTVAEGVETLKQLSLLREMNCDEVQGYLYSKPVEPKTFEALLTNGVVNRQSNNQGEIPQFK